MKYITLFLLMLGLSESFAQRPLSLRPSEIDGRWDWEGGNNTFVTFSNNLGYMTKITPADGDKDVGLTYELIDSEEKLYKIKWFSKSTGQVLAIDHLVLKYGNNGAYLEGASVTHGVFIRAFKR